MENKEILAQNIQVVIAENEELVNKGDLSSIDKYWTEDAIWRGGSLGEYHGRAALKEMAEANVGKAFTEMHIEIKNIIASGDKVVVHFINSGLNSGSFMGYSPTNKTAKWQGMGIYRLANGRIEEATFSEDILDVFIQLGLLGS